MCYPGVAVLGAIEQDKLQQNAHELGTYLIHHLQALQKVHFSQAPGTDVYAQLKLPCMSCNNYSGKIAVNCMTLCTICMYTSRFM